MLSRSEIKKNKGRLELLVVTAPSGTTRSEPTRSDHDSGNKQGLALKSFRIRAKRNKGSAGKFGLKMKMQLQFR